MRWTHKNVLLDATKKQKESSELYPPGRRSRKSEQKLLNIAKYTIHFYEQCNSIFMNKVETYF